MNIVPEFSRKTAEDHRLECAPEELVMFTSVRKPVSGTLELESR